MERTVLITGAGTGIGLASALEAARLGFRVVAAVHEPEQEGAVARAAVDAGVGEAVVTEVLDVTDPGRSEEVLGRAEPWALVNNAGTAVAGALVDVPDEDARRQLELLVLAPMRLARQALPGMRRSGGGRIVNVSSIAHETLAPYLGWYEASKAALSALSDVLRQEVARHGVDVVLVEPGVVGTGIWDDAVEDLRRRRAQALEPELYEQAVEAFVETASHGVEADDVAKAVGEALHAGHPPFRYRVGAGAHALPVVGRFVPTSLRDRITRTVAGL